MSDASEAWELDSAWFRKNFPFVATEDESDAFCERVAIKMADGMGESRARFESVSELRKIRNATSGEG